MRKIKKKIDINKRNHFSGFKKIIFLSMLQRFKQDLNYFPLNAKQYKNEHLVKNRCSYTGRPKNVIRKYRLGRSQLKEFIYLGFISGVRRTSW